MKKLKIILKYNKLILLFIIILSFLFTKIYNHNIKIDINKKEIYGYVRKIDNNKLEITSDEKIVVYIENPRVELNDYVLVKGDLFYPNNNTLFNLYNYKKYYSNKRIYLFMKSNDLRIIKKNNNIFFKLKNTIYKKINSYKSKKYLKLFILGNKEDLDNKEIISNIGIIHLFSLSGLHISLICYLLKKIKCKNIIIYLLLGFFLFLTDFHISTSRAVLSFIFLNVNNRYKLNISSLDRLIILAWFLLIINPFFLYDLGYIFSFLISYTILYFSSLYKNDNYLIKSIKISFITFIVSIPLVINNYYSINFLSIIFNIMLIPIVSFIIFPLSIITLVIPIDSYFYQITLLFDKLCELLDSVKTFTFSFGKIPLFLILLFYFVIFMKNRFKYIMILFLTFILYFMGLYVINPKVYFIDQTTPNMIQRISGIFERNPLISKEI